MLSYLKRFSFSALLVVILAVFAIFNPYTSLDILVFLVIIFIIFQKILGEYFILMLLIVRPAIDIWRDFTLFSYQSFNFNINAALSTLLLIWSAYFFWKHRSYLKQIPAIIPWILFLAWCAITLVYSYDVAATITETMKAANLFALFGISYILYSKNGVKFKKDFIKSLICAAIIPLAVGVYQFISQTGMNIDDIRNRIYGTFAHPNIMATFALLLLTVLLHEYPEKHNIFKNKLSLENAIGIFLLLIIALTYTRIAWIGTAVLLLVVGIIYFKKLVLYLIIGAGLFYLIFYPLNAFLINNFNYNMQSYGIISRLTARNEESDSVSWRIDVATKVLPLIKDRLVLGYGYGSFATVWDNNKGIQNLWDNTSEAHNDFLKIAFEGGLIGIGLYLLIFAALLWEQVKFGIKNNWKNIVFITSIIVYLVLSLSDNMLHHTPVIWWMWAVWGVWACEYKKV
ncbi:MAG: O-antigen ligase family protein [Patescibacteria group bacterium]